MADRGLEAPATSHETAAFRAMAESASRLAPGARVLPLLGTGATDLRFLRAKGVEGYGISPCPTGEAEEGTVHGDDERVRLESVTFGVRFALEAVRALAR